MPGKTLVRRGAWPTNIHAPSGRGLITDNNSHRHGHSHNNDTRVSGDRWLQGISSFNDIGRYPWTRLIWQLTATDGQNGPVSWVLRHSKFCVVKKRNHRVAMFSAYYLPDKISSSSLLAERGQSWTVLAVKPGKPPIAGLLL